MEGGTPYRTCEKCGSCREKERGNIKIKDNWDKLIKCPSCGGRLIDKCPKRGNPLWSPGVNKVKFDYSCNWNGCKFPWAR